MSIKYKDYFLYKNTYIHQNAIYINIMLCCKACNIFVAQYVRQMILEMLCLRRCLR